MYCTVTHICSQFQQHLDGMALSPGSRSMERSVVLLVLDIHVSSTANKAVDAVSVAWEGLRVCVCVCVCVFENYVKMNNVFLSAIHRILLLIVATCICV